MKINFDTVSRVHSIKVRQEEAEKKVDCYVREGYFVFCFTSLLISFLSRECEKKKMNKKKKNKKKKKKRRKQKRAAIREVTRPCSKVIHVER